MRPDTDPRLVRKAFLLPHKLSYHSSIPETCLLGFFYTVETAAEVTTGAT